MVVLTEHGRAHLREHHVGYQHTYPELSDNTSGHMTAPTVLPDLIDLDTGDEYEWVTKPAGGGAAGYAHEDDHDFAWPREELKRDGARLAEVDSLDPGRARRIAPHPTPPAN
jgi:hypothetical protein